MFKTSEQTRLQNLELKSVIGGKKMPVAEVVCECFCSGDTSANDYMNGKHDGWNNPPKQ